MDTSLPSSPASRARPSRAHGQQAGAKPAEGTFLTVAASDEEITRAPPGSVQRPRDLVGWRVRVHDAELDAGEEGVVVAVHKAVGAPTKHRIRFDGDGGRTRLVTLDRKGKRDSKHKQFELLEAPAPPPPPGAAAGVAPPARAAGGRGRRGRRARAGVAPESVGVEEDGAVVELLREHSTDIAVDLGKSLEPPPPPPARAPPAPPRAGGAPRAAAARSRALGALDDGMKLELATAGGLKTACDGIAKGFQRRASRARRASRVSRAPLAPLPRARLARVARRAPRAPRAPRLTPRSSRLSRSARTRSRVGAQARTSSCG